LAFLFLGKHAELSQRCSWKECWYHCYMYERNV